MHDAIPGMRMEGKPQCHIIIMCQGTAGSRRECGLHAEPRADRTAEQPDDVCAPAGRLAEVVEQLRRPVRPIRQ